MNPLKRGSYTPSDLPKGVYISMTPGLRYKDRYGKRTGAPHKGYDFAGPLGTPVYAAVGGYADHKWATGGWGYGKFGLALVQKDGNLQIYGHMSSRLTKDGEWVNAGEQVGTIGSEGFSTGPHLHFDARNSNNQVIDTERYIRDKSTGTDVWKPETGSKPPPVKDPGNMTETTPELPVNEVPKPPGHGFEETRRLIDLHDLRTNSLFNAPIAFSQRLPDMYKSAPGTDGSNSDSADGSWLSMNQGTGRGWIVRDPVAMIGAGGYPDTDLPDWNKNPDADGDGEQDPDKEGSASAKITADGYESARYGFRFLMNPTNHTEKYLAANVDTGGFLTDVQRLQNAPVVVDTGSTLSFELLLDRRADHWLIPRHLNDPVVWTLPVYGEVLQQETLDEIWKYGTQYDLEYLFRTLVPAREGLWHGRVTADFGVMLPYPIIVSIGDSSGARRIRGSIVAAQIEHIMFAPGMIPIQSMVKLSIRRGTDSWYSLDDFDEKDHGKEKEDGSKDDGTPPPPTVPQPPPGNSYPTPSPSPNPKPLPPPTSNYPTGGVP